jgi:outer membrane immunogenic protein
MKKILLASVALFGFAGAASAADLPMRAAPPAPIIAAAPIFTWTGFYVGVNAGYGWHNDDSNAAVFVPGGAVGVGSPAGTITFGDSEGDGFVGGGQIGYNYQTGSFVIGVETDIQWADLGGDNGTAVYPAAWNAYAFRPAGVAGGVDWFGTVRARAGVAFDRALIYATGGFAYGGGEGSNDFFGNDDDVRTGWTLGGGVEYAFTNNLTGGLEGLWVNLDNDNNTYVGSSVPALGADRRAVEAPGSRDSESEFFLVRAKLNYKFSSY